MIYGYSFVFIKENTFGCQYIRFFISQNELLSDVKSQVRSYLQKYYLILIKFLQQFIKPL